MISQVLLAASLLEMAADPRLGDDVNDMASWQFEDAVSRDEVLRSRLLGDVRLDGPDDAAQLSFAAWMWFTKWRQRQGAKLDDELLAALSQRAFSGDRRLRIRALVGRDATLNAEAQQYEGLPLNADALPLRWLTWEVTDATTGRTDPYELVRHLLQIGTDVSLLTLATLADVDFDDRAAVRAELRSRFSTDLLSDEQVQRWRRRLSLDDN